MKIDAAGRVEIDVGWRPVAVDAAQRVVHREEAAEEHQLGRQPHDDADGERAGPPGPEAAGGTVADERPPGRGPPPGLAADDPVTASGCTTRHGCDVTGAVGVRSPCGVAAPGSNAVDAASSQQSCGCRRRSCWWWRRRRLCRRAAASPGGGGAGRRPAPQRSCRARRDRRRHPDGGGPLRHHPVQRPHRAARAPRDVAPVLFALGRADHARPAGGASVHQLVLRRTLDSRPAAVLTNPLVATVLFAAHAVGLYFTPRLRVVAALRCRPRVAPHPLRGRRRALRRGGGRASTCTGTG